MLRRSSTRNRNRRPLSRSKSTNSISRSPVHFEIIDPVAAKRDAHIAALISYRKSQNQTFRQSPPSLREHHSFVMERNGSAPSSARLGLERDNSAKSLQNTSRDASGIRRQKSVRFVGPAARPRRNLASRASEHSIGSGLTTHGLHVLGSVDNRPASTLSCPRPTTDPHGLTKRYLESLQVPSEIYTPEDDIASMPSSYRRLRKSRSMFSTFNPLNTGCYLSNRISETGNTKLVGYDAAIHRKENDPLSTNHPPRPSTSLSVLKGRRDTASSRCTSRAENDLAVQLARERFRNHVQEQTLLKPRPSIFFGSKNKRSESALGFRKSLRTSSNNSTGLSSTFSGHSSSMPKQAGLRTTARKVSKTLRSKLKGLFTRPKCTSESEVRDDEQNTHESEGESCLPFDEDKIPQETSVLRVPSHVPSLHAVSSNQELRSRRGSVESIGSAEKQISDDKSRVTSWTDSITNTASSTEDWECRRLSMIDENVPQMQSSNSAQKQSAGQDQGSSGLPTSGQPVCSVLLKRMNEIKKQEEALTNVVNNMQTPASGLESGGWKSSSIRYVGVEDDVFGDQKNKPETEIRHQSKYLTNSEEKNTPNRLSACDAGEVDEGETLTTRESCEAGTHINTSATISKRSSAFFASPTCHLFRTASPYRRAFQENMKTSEERQSADIPSSKYFKSLSDISLPTRRPSSSESDKDPRMDYAESIYSCGTEDVKQPVSTAATPSKPQWHGSPIDQNNGSTTVFVDETACKLPSQHRRHVSAASSVEWMTLLSANVSKLEGSTVLSRMGNGENQQTTLPALGHVRERAEIYSAQEVIRPVRVNSDGSPIRNPLESVQGNARLKPVAMVSHTNVDKGMVHSDENEAPWGASSPGLQRGPPKVPPRSQLRVGSCPPESHDESQISQSANLTDMVREGSFNNISEINSSLNEAHEKRHTPQNIAEKHGSPAKPSPDLTVAIERQFVNTASGSPAHRAGYNTSQSTPRSRNRIEVKDEDGKSKWARGLNLDTPTMDSKQMVNMFLDNRRRRTPGDITGTEMGSSPAAFI